MNRLSSSASPYLLGDHLGSTSIVTNAAGSLQAETRYKPWGEVRFTTANQTLPTRYTFTGQYSYISDSATDLTASASFGLMFYNARWYDPMTGCFAQADTIVPGGVQGLDRYSYVGNNPVRFTDPSGHSCVPADECGGNPHAGGYSTGSPSLLEFETDPGQSFTEEEMQTLEAGAQAVAGALAREIRSQCSRFEQRSGDCHWVTPQQAFYGVFGGPIKVKRVVSKCETKTGECWAEHKTPGPNSQYEIWIYSNTTTQDIVNYPRLIVHEIGHAFLRAIGYSGGSSPLNAMSAAGVNNRFGFAGSAFRWQLSTDISEMEIYADMFVGWVYGRWETNYSTGDLSEEAKLKLQFMTRTILDMNIILGW